MMNLVLVGAGGAVGAMARYLTGLGFARWVAPDAPYLATLAVNVVGGLLMGLLAGVLVGRGSEAEPWRLLLGVGLLGGFTTFSSFSLEVVALWRDRAFEMAAVYILASVALSVGGVVVGLYLARVGAS